jgi:hypothetical protein
LTKHLLRSFGTTALDIITTFAIFPILISSIPGGREDGNKIWMW